MGLIYAIDPGNEESALCVYDPVRARPVSAMTVVNETMLVELIRRASPENTLVIEKIESYGMAVGAEVFETVFWSGRFHQSWLDEASDLTERMVADRVSRKSVKLHLCGSARATDANIRQAIYDRYGGKLRARGTKHMPGALYGLKGHEYAALAVAITFAETKDAEG